MSLTNYERWLSYTSTLPSPDNYVQWSWLFLISAALQRRVWIGPDHMRRYPNMYVILCGRAGLGKGMVIKPVSTILKYHKLPDPISLKVNGVSTAVDKDILKEALLNDYKRAQEAEQGKQDPKTTKTIEKPLLFPVAPDATTYEALVEAMASSIRRINYTEFDPITQKDVMKIYTHSSMCFCLEELSSLFRRHTEDTVNFLLVSYDCGDYTKRTKHSGIDRVRKCCLSILGGTTPSFMQSTFDDKLLNEGFASRTFYIYADRNRRKFFFPPDLSEEQNGYYNDILKHVQVLGSIYGRARIDKETEDWVQNWLDKSDKSRTNNSPRLDGYYARSDNHLAKVAMALHFSESTELYVPLHCFQHAAELLSAEEKNMHKALGIDSQNPLAVPARKILSYLLTRGRKTKKQLTMEFWSLMPNGVTGIEEVLEYLMSINKIHTVDGEPVGGQIPILYEAISEEGEI